MSNDLRHLPPTVVPYLNALSHKATNHRDEVEGFLAALQQMTDWWEFQRGYSIDDQEEGQFENLKVLHEEMREAIYLPTKQEQLDQLVPDLYQAVALMDSINARREAPHYSSQLAVNDFLLCGAAWLQGRADDEAVLSRLERLKAYAGVLRHAFIGARTRLLPEVVESLEAGLNHFRQGMEAVDLENREQFQDSLASIKEGADIMQFLIDWQRQDVQRQAQTSSRFTIPVAGPHFQEALEQARELPREQWRRGIKYLESVALAQLESSWAHLRSNIFWEPNQRLEIWEEISLSIEDLKNAVADLDNQQFTPEQALDNLEEALETLSAAFRQARLNSLEHQHLQGTQAGYYIEALLGALNGSLPFLAFPELFHASPPPEEWKAVVQHMLNYGSDLEVDHLYRAGYLLLQRYPPPPPQQEVPEGWVCPNCGHSNPGGTRCGACHIAPISLSAEAWSG
ncbi:hypothetical protein JST97_13920 [bacterium]|nr:hypothetical protein [bacterium]